MFYDIQSMICSRKYHPEFNMIFLYQNINNKYFYMYICLLYESRIEATTWDMFPAIVMRPGYQNNQSLGCSKMEKIWAPQDILESISRHFGKHLKMVLRCFPQTSWGDYQTISRCILEHVSRCLKTVSRWSQDCVKAPISSI